MNTTLRLTAVVLVTLAGTALSGCERAPAGVDTPQLTLQQSSVAHKPLPAAPADLPTAAEFRDLSARVALLERERKQATRPAIGQAGAPAPTEAELRAGPRGAAPGRDMQLLETERQAELDGLFRQEPVNAAWAGVTSAAVRQALPAPVDGHTLALRDVQCRSQTCRVEVGAVGDDAMRTALPQLARRLAERLPSMAVVSRSDGSGATLYFRS
jgi:hypothetical protein